MTELHSDGYTVGANPAHAGGFTIFKGGKLLLTHRFVRPPSLFPDAPITNNEMELLGVHYAAVLAPKGAKLITDSEVMTWWIKNGNSKARKDLNEIIRFTQELIKEKSLTLEWRPREENHAGHYNENNFNA